nr:hypothetical protein LVJ77_09865 [Conchiformibius kuhniae]
MKIAIPEDVPVSAVFQEWCRQTGYEFSPDDKRYYYNGGWWEDGAMLAFSHERGRLFLHAFAMSKTLEGKIFFALNAPVWIAKQKRRNKLKQLNKLLRHWQIEPIKMK